MKLLIDGAEVTISVKGKHSNKANAEDTMFFLCAMSSAFSVESTRLENLGLHAAARKPRRMSNDIFEFLDSKGYFDDVK